MSGEPYKHLDATVIDRLMDLGILGDLLPIFEDTIPQVFDELDRVNAESDDLAMQQLLHRLKGICANMGAGEMARLCQSMERGGQVYARDVLERAFGNAKAELRTLVK